MQYLAYKLFRFNSIILAAAFVTLLLFYWMQLLIQTGDSVPQRLAVIDLVDTTMPFIEPILIVNIDPPEPIAPPVPKVETPNPPTQGIGNPTGFVPIFEASPPSSPSSSIPFSPGIMVPLIRTAPNYPNRAAARGIEGFVELSFTVNALGEVEDPVVLNAQPEGYFENAALQSIRRWKYSPATDGGIAVATYDVRQRIVFQMEGNAQ